MSPHVLLFPKVEPGFELGPVFSIPLSFSMPFSYFTDNPLPNLLFSSYVLPDFRKELSGLSMPFTYSIL